MAQRQNLRLQGIEPKGKTPVLRRPARSRVKWKTQMSEPETSVPGPEEERLPLPPATFPFLILSLRTQAEMAMGLLHFGEEKDLPEPDLDAARHGIDLIAMLQEKTRGNLSLEEQRLIDNSLTELRFRYVQAVGEKAQPKNS